jgi:hypothetical protein
VAVTSTLAIGEFPRATHLSVKTAVPRAASWLVLLGGWCLFVGNGDEAAARGNDPQSLPFSNPARVVVPAGSWLATPPPRTTQGIATARRLVP